MREGLDEKLDLWLEIGHFQVFPIDRFLPDKSCTLALSCGFGSPIRVCFNEACAKGDRRAWHGGYFAREQCMWTHVCRRAVTGAPPEIHSSEGGGVWAEYLPKAALTSNTLFLDDANVLVPVWLGGRGDRPAFPIGRNRIF